MAADAQFMRLALRLARRGYGATSPNPMVGAVLVRAGRVVGRGWHRGAGQAHAEIEALRDARTHGENPKGSTLYVTLEPCCTQGRTPPCTTALIAAGIRRVVAAATDPNPRHCGRGFAALEKSGIAVEHGLLAEESALLNQAFNHWIVHRTPWVTVKAAMTLDGKIATAGGQSKWITGAAARAYSMKLRRHADAILVGINTVCTDDPALSDRGPRPPKQPRRLVLDSLARTPLDAQVLSDRHAALTTIIISKTAPEKRVRALAKRVRVLVDPSRPGSAHGPGQINLRWLLQTLGREEVTSLLVEGGGEVNASFLMQGLAHRVAFFFAPKILGGRDSRLAVGGQAPVSLTAALVLSDLRWRRLGPDWLLTAAVGTR